MKGRILLLAATVVATQPVPSWAQEVQLPTAEEYAKRAAKAESAPLFARDEALEIVLRADISWIRDERSDVDETEGTVAYRGPDGAEISVPVKVRARGNFRRDKRNCNFPPIRLNFAGKQVEGTVFEDQDKLKLVTPCHDSRDAYQQYILQEYLVYRAFQLLTPTSFRVRLVKITYEDPDGGYETRTQTAFVIEDDESMAARNRATLSEWEQFHPDAMDDAQASLVALFQYMIGNTDFSLPMFHNAVMIRSEDARYLMVPYDFDWSGIVNARYAVPDPQLEIRNVRERVYRGFCREGADPSDLIARFNAQREGIRALYDGMEDLKDNERKRSLEYVDKFFETLNDERRFRRDVIEACRRVGG
jgi:hypothetical protein